MPPKARAKRITPPPPAPVIKNMSAKRGRPPKADIVEMEAEPPKKRGRPAKAKVEEPALPVKSTRKRGRPPKSAPLNLGRVAGSARVAKPTRTSARIDPRMRSRLRARIPSANKAPKTPEKKAVAVPARRGRPRKIRTEASLAKKAVDHKAATPAQAKPPRKRRGFTMLEIPDRFVAQLEQSLQGLLDAELSESNSKEQEDQEEQDLAASDYGENVSQQDEVQEEEQSDEQDNEPEDEQDKVDEKVDGLVNGLTQVDGIDERLEEAMTVLEETSEPLLDTKLQLHTQHMDQVIQSTGHTEISMFA